VLPASALEPGDIVLQIQPAERELNLSPGTRHQGSLEVANIGRLPFDFTVSTRPYQVLNENYDPDFSTANDYTKLANWIHFSRTSYHLAAGESINVNFEIIVPSDVPGGGQYAAIIVETRDSQDDQATMRTVNQVASLIYARVAGETRFSGHIVDQSLPRFLLGSPFTSSVTIQNDGNIDFRATHSLAIYDFFTNREVFSPEAVDAEGQVVGTVSPVILPGTSRTSRLTWDGAPQLGVFRAVSTVSFLETNETKEQIVFICPVWLAGLVVFFVVLMLLWLILRIRKRHQKKPQVV